MTDADRERILDKRIQHRLARDKGYLWAENAEEQAEREAEIEREEEAILDREIERAAFARRMEQARL